MRTYLAGPMRRIPLYNFPAFDAAAADLRSHGLTVISPAELDRQAGFDPTSLPADWDWATLPDHFSLDAAMKRDLEAIATVDAIHLLPGWQHSKGAQAERAVALWRGLSVFEYQPQRRVVGLFGYYGSGKDEAAKALLADGWARVSFADPLRKMALGIDPLVRTGNSTLGLAELVQLRGWTEAKKFPDCRRFLQRLGTEGVRNVLGANTWTDLAERAMPADKSIVFTDVRFENEAELIRRYGGKLIQIRRPGYKPAQDHASERYGFEADETILNDGTIEDLHAKIRNAVPKDCREMDAMRAGDERRVIPTAGDWG